MECAEYSVSLWNIQLGIMDRICCIVDFEGFWVNSTFLAREIGWINISTGMSGTVRFDLRGYQRSLPDLMNCDYITENISGLTFEPMLGEPTISPHLLDGKIREIYSNCRTPYKHVIAYKGGHVEKDVLERLGIPCINLELFNCPKFEQISRGNYQTCGFHKYNGHCPLAEVHAFRAWMLARL
ncbi:uncharacterized protein [Parasteatoda tepidariorum]|uniref:uncharacterized protein n=1 Tax=Parasteatoda tepidariorum TaxID=114398 RepID=UPI001C7293E2|nr:uncharacterized protein LOC107442674 [Parasteatoda tepidariorum]